MRTRFLVASLLSAVAVVLTTSVAFADVAGTYEVKYEEVSTNCNSPLKYPAGKLVVKQPKGTSVTVDIDRTPLIQGSVGKAGKVSAKSKSGNTSLDGMTGVFSVAGKITPEGILSFVMVGEYSAGGRPLCSQSWNVSGTKSEAALKAGKK
ncbi:MAG: hypothetical protein H0T42_10335 [Deltaproteobacteria bacterium]|nr:hypothetical protein [Deltaproteobacteria bacterium]